MEGLKLFNRNNYEYEGIRIETSELFRGNQFISHAAGANHIRSASIEEYFSGTMEKIPFLFDYVSDYIDGSQRITAASHTFFTIDSTRAGAYLKCTREIDLYRKAIRNCVYISSHPSETI